MSHKNQIRTTKGQFGKLKPKLPTLQGMTDSELYAQREKLISQLGVLEYRKAFIRYHSICLENEIHDRELLKQQGEVPKHE